MELLTPQEVVQLPLNESEELHRSRTRRPFDVFLSRGVQHIKMQPVETQRKLYFDEMGEHAGAGDTDSLSSSDSLWFELNEKPLSYRFIAKIVCRHWDRLGADKKEAWRQRTLNLNLRNLPGAIYNIPGKIYLQFLYSFSYS